MRVLHVTAGNLFGGIERMLLGIVSAAQDDCTHEIAVSFDGRLARELRACGQAPHVLGEVRFRRPDTVWRARRALRRVVVAAPPDTLVAHAPWSCALAAPIARRLNIPLVMWAHDRPHPEQWPERRVSRTPPDRFICNSRYTAGLVASWMPGVKSDVIYPPVRRVPPLDAAERAAVRAALGAGDGTAVILLAARLEEWKGHRILLEAAGRLRGDSAIWIAGGPQREAETAYLDELLQLARGGATASRSHFLGERSDVPRLMAAADVYCQPNTAPEPFGVALVEALGAGIPVVTAAMGGALEIVDEECGVLVADPSPDSVAGALQGLIDEPAARRSLGARGPDKARRISDPAARLRQIRDLVRDLRVRRSAA